MNKRKAKKIGEWLNYLIGFTRCGSTALDEKPRRRLGRKEALYIQKAKKFMEEENKRRHEGFRQACIDVLGDDPDTDWD
jgi:hypothetical protein